VRSLLSAAALTLLAGPAVACLNDSEVRGHEREFRSQYRGTKPAAPSESGSWQQPALAGAGTTLVVGAALVAVRSTRAKA
jgi:hypothetical protein